MVGAWGKYIQELQEGLEELGGIIEAGNTHWLQDIMSSSFLPGMRGSLTAYVPEPCQWFVNGTAFIASSYLEEQTCRAARFRDVLLGANGRRGDLTWAETKLAEVEAWKKQKGLDRQSGRETAMRMIANQKKKERKEGKSRQGGAREL
ncbi:uncharacterized protein KY384_002881 [Bacidia gigantensis]|uniref:uncharacterized protein n=1 Tax=Bacidia gigantensis TaxID=2732470 RepID=UPI001D051B97|nr:uncharacterized protein KY384_002881 [Bacidia gigantensis]KAG8532396.1 hypothetical protein KY384_002881 [Bacidia gigantensis]